jgi:hypothetical protein
VERTLVFDQLAHELGEVARLILPQPECAVVATADDRRTAGAEGKPGDHALVAAHRQPRRLQRVGLEHLEVAVFTRRHHPRPVGVDGHAGEGRVSGRMAQQAPG